MARARSLVRSLAEQQRLFLASFVDTVYLYSRMLKSDTVVQRTEFYAMQASRLSAKAV